MWEINISQAAIEILDRNNVLRCNSCDTYKADHEIYTDDDGKYDDVICEDCVKKQEDK